MQCLISDANILIDIEEGQLIDEMFQLPYEFCVPDILFFEELEAQHSHLLSKGLKVLELYPDYIKYGLELSVKYVRTSRNDCLTLALAKQEKCTLLTGDKALRLAAANESVEVKGTIWVMQQMHSYKLINLDRAEYAFDLMETAGRRLPKDAVNVFLQSIRG